MEMNRPQSLTAVYTFPLTVRLKFMDARIILQKQRIGMLQYITLRMILIFLNRSFFYSIIIWQWSRPVKQISIIQLIITAHSVNRLQIPLIQQGECIMDTSRRIENLRGVMREKNIDLSIIVDFQNQFYFSGLKAITYTRPIILAIDSTKMSLIVPSLEEKDRKSTR